MSDRDSLIEQLERARSKLTGWNAGAVADAITAIEQGEAARAEAEQEAARERARTERQKVRAEAAEAEVEKLREALDRVRHENAEGVGGKRSQDRIEALCATALSPEQAPQQRRVCPECGEEDQGNDAHDGECSQLFPYLTPSELATYEKLRPCFVEAWKREQAPQQGGGEDEARAEEIITRVLDWCSTEAKRDGNDYQRGRAVAASKLRTDIERWLA